MENNLNKALILVLKIVSTVIISLVIPYACIIALLSVALFPIAYNIILSIAGALLLPSLIPFIWVKKRKKYLKGWLCGILAAGIAAEVRPSPFTRYSITGNKPLYRYCNGKYQIRKS